MHHRLPLAASLALVPFVALSLWRAPDAAAQSTGFVHLKTYEVSLDPSLELGTSHTFVQGGSGLVETFTQEFAPGPHTFARVESTYGNCRATADNVSFTITAGQWTDVSVPLTFQDCYVGIRYDVGNGIGDVNYSVIGNTGTLPIADCQLGYDAQGQRVFTHFHECQGTVPYGATITATITPGSIKSCCTGTASFVANVPGHLLLDFTNREYGFLDSSAAPHPQPNFNTDLSISRIGGSYGGQVMVAVFRVVNHGANDAVGVALDVAPDSATGHDGNAVATYSVADGNCFSNTGGCSLAFLPAGDSTTFTVRYSGAPAAVGDSSDRHSAKPLAAVTTRTPACASARVHSEGNSETNTANNTASCIDTAIPVTVALGGSTPPNRTVQMGALNVPMLEFLVTPTSQQTVNSVTLSASGTGNEQLDVTAVNLYVDKNGNGQVDSGDSVIATSTFAANDGTVTMNVSPIYTISAPTNLLVTYSFSLTFAQRLSGGEVTLAMFPLLLLPAVRRRKRVMAMVVMTMLTTVALTACGGDSATGPPHTTGSVTFQSNLTSVNVSGTEVASPLAGATITVNK